MTMLEQMAKAAYEADSDAGVRMPPWAILPRKHSIRILYLKRQAAALKVLNSEVRAIRNRAEAEFPNCPEGADFEEFTVRICELFDGMLKDAP